MVDVTILTRESYLQNSGTEYMNNVFREYESLRLELESRGLQVERISWDDKNYDFYKTKCVLFRTIWDYFERYDEFQAFLHRIKNQTKLINPLSLIEWNIDKRYLLDLENKGVEIVPTVYMKQGARVSLIELCDEKGWDDIVIKPAISGSAYLTYHLDEDAIAVSEELFQELLSQRSMLVQPFIPSIQTKGEASLMVMNGEYTHAIIKHAAKGDYRVQDDYGGTVHDYEPSKKEIEFAEYVFAQCETVPAYGRADIVWGEQGEILLGELEIIEPELWTRFSPESVKPFVDGIIRLME